MKDINPYTIQAAWDAYVIAISEGKTERTGVIEALRAADDIRARMVHEVIRKKFKGSDAA